MKTSLRNCLAELLLSSFNESEKHIALNWLSAFCQIASQRERPEIPLPELLSTQGLARSQIGSDVETALAHLLQPGKLLQIRRAETSEVPQVFNGSMLGPVEANLWLIEPQPNVRAAFPEVCERVRIYADLVTQTQAIGMTSSAQDPLRKAMAEAALCFNAGLFFEAHEHLEHYWAMEPKGPTKRLLQGIIQISVGFHHACLGKYDGAINQLGTGLEKMIGTTGEFLGLDCDAFLPEVKAVRDAVIKRGRARMCPFPLSGIPRMRIRV